MKKTILLTFISFGIFLFTGCSEAAPVSDFMPIEHNLRLRYEVEGEQFEIIWETFITYVNDTIVQRYTRTLVSPMPMNIIEVVDIRQNEIVLINARENAADNVDITNLPQAVHSSILAGPIEVGTTWPEAPGSATWRQITGLDISVATPAGTFDTIEVTTTLPLEPGQIEPGLRRQYFAPGIGMVKEISYSPIVAEGMEPRIDVTRLISIERDARLVRDIEIFFGGQAFPFTIEYYTNNSLTDLYTEALHTVAYQIFGRSLPQSLYINYAILNPDSRNLALDFSAAFLTEMSSVSDEGMEWDILQAIVDTFGALYDAEGVHISVDGQAYSGRFVSLNMLQFLPRTIAYAE